jgi:hypothetical protein
VLYGAADPTGAQGVNGNFYINTTSHFIFGPKAAGAWPAGASLIGPQGATGPQGLPGAGSPATALPLMDGVAAVGTSTNFAREDHVHPTAMRAVRNIIINGDFRINQRVYASGAVLAAGAYGHDRWKAGASGGDYSFTQLKSSTQITIAANKTLIQVVEDVNVMGGNYVLSWTGTCQARVGLNSATPSGAYANSPILVAGQTAGTIMSVEFGNGAAIGTLGTVQLETGTPPTPFDFTPFSFELSKCQRYYEKSYDYATVPGTATANGLVGCGVPAGSGVSNVGSAIIFQAHKRASPTMALWSGGGVANYFSTGLGSTTDSYNGISPQNVCAHSFAMSNSTTASTAAWAHFTATAEL